MIIRYMFCIHIQRQESIPVLLWNRGQQRFNDEEKREKLVLAHSFVIGGRSLMSSEISDSKIGADVLDKEEF